MNYRVVYGETMPAWERTFPSRREAETFANRCRERGDIVFSVARTVPGEPPKSLMGSLST